MKKPKIKRKKRIDISFHFWSFLFLVLVAALLILILVLWLVLNGTETVSTTPLAILLYVVPSCAVCLIATAMYFNRFNQKHINKLMEGINHIAVGDYSYKITANKGIKNEYNEIYEVYNKMAEELSSVQTLRESFIHDFSHEFKTPISSINGFANLLIEGNLSEEEQKRFLKIIADESARLSHLSESTLLLSNLDNISFVGEKKPFRLDLQIKDVVIMLEDKWSKKDITVSCEMEEVVFSGKDEYMRQVWINLISNAIKFTPQGGEINITLALKQTKILVSVQDNGVGMSQEVKARVFDKYYQGDKSRSVEGNGLGLAIVKRIIDLHDGQIYVDSVEGEGSVFTVELSV